MYVYSSQKTDPQKGFTLIELLIVIVTMFFIFTAGYANLRGFQRRKILDGAVLKVRSNLRLAQQMALSGQKPPYAACVRLSAVNFRYSGTTYTLFAECYSAVGNRVNIQYSPQINYTFLGSEYDGVSFQGTRTINFEVLGKGVRNATPPIVITLNLSGVPSRTITVTSGGQIYEN